MTANSTKTINDKPDIQTKCDNIVPVIEQSSGNKTQVTVSNNSNEDDDDGDRELVIDLPEADEQASTSNNSLEVIEGKKEEVVNNIIKTEAKNDHDDESSLEASSSNKTKTKTSKSDKSKSKDSKTKPKGDKDETKNKLDRLCICIPCKFTLYKSLDYRFQLKNHFRSQCRFKCFFCFKHYRSFSTMVKHIGIHLAQEKSNLAYKCTYCPKSFEDCFQLKRHTYTAHPKHYKKIFSKPENSVQDLVKERVAAEAQFTEFSFEQEEEEAKKITCDECFDEFETKKQYKQHKELHRSIAADREKKPTPMVVDDDYMEIFEDASNNKYEIVTTISTKRGSNGFINY